MNYYKQFISAKAIVEETNFKSETFKKEYLEKLIDKMETQLVQGGHAIEDHKDKEQARKIRAMQLKLK